MKQAPVEPEPSTALVVTLKSLPTVAAVELFKPGALDHILACIEAEARKEASGLEISTEASRQAIASLAYKIARSKTYIDDQGKSLTEDARKQIDAVNGDRKVARERLDGLKDEIRKPLTEWENLDKDRQAAHEKRLSQIETSGTLCLQHWQSLAANDMRERLTEVEAPRDWEEFSQRAAGVKAVAKEQITQAIERREAYDKEQAELTRLGAEEAERVAKAREEAAARAATEAAEKKAQEEKDAAQRASQAEYDRLRGEAEYAENKRIAAEQEAKRQADQAEARRIADAQAAERRAKEAADKAEADQKRAIEAERQRVADAQKAEREAAEKREANKRHVAKINKEVKKAMMYCDLNGANISVEAVDGLISAIAKGLIPHVSIEY